MKTGLLWFDDDPRRQLEEKVLRAAMHYERKYGATPNLCFVHPSLLNGNDGNDGNGKHGKQILQRAGGGVKRAGGVEIRPRTSVLPDHFWLGIAEDKVQDARCRIQDARRLP